MPVPFRQRSSITPEAGRLSADGAQRQAEKAAPPSILLVEDELLVRLCVAEELRDSGYVVYEAAEAGEAFSVLNENTVDLLLTDIRMPGALDGLELAKRVRDELPEMRIVLMSANITRETETFDGVFPKPVRVAGLLLDIKKLLA
jgi:CheY-like chemotaxis protein